MMEFNVNPKKRRVAAFDTDFSVYRDLRNLVFSIDNGLITSNIYDKLVDSVYDGKPIIGVAKCNPEDEFDEEIGKKIAMFKYKQKIKKLKIQLLKAYKRQLDKVVEHRYNQIDAKIRRYM